MFLGRSKTPGKNHSTLVLVDANGDEYEALGNSNGEFFVARLAMERDRGSANAHSVANPSGNGTPFNPRAASVGSTPGAIGALGTTELLIGAGVPVTVLAVLFELDSVGSLLLRDAVATNTSVPAQIITASFSGVGRKFLQGLCVTGSGINTCAWIIWHPTGTNT